MNAARLPAAAPHTPRGTPRPSKRSRFRLLALVLVHVAAIAHVAHWKLAGSTFTPLEPSEAGETLTLGYVNAGFLVFGLTILATLVFGRFFCGWACHVVAYQDACAWLLGKLGIRPKPIRSRLLVFVPLLAALWMFVLPSVLRAADGQGLLPESWRLHLSTDDFWARFPGFWVAALTFAVDGFLVVYLLGAKGFCTYGCPYGAIFALADRRARGRIRVTDACEGCGHCTATCTSNVRVHEEVARFGQVVDAGCMKCMDCVSVCPKDALYFGFGDGRASAVAAGRSGGRKVWDFTWSEELAMAAAFVVAMLVWRDAYSAVPFLLAIGLATMAALSVALAWRLLRRRELVFQHAVLRRGGRLTGAGVTGVTCIGAFLLLTGHSGYVHWHAWRGEAELTAVRAELPGICIPQHAPGGAVAERARGALAHFEAARAAGLFDDVDVRSGIAALLCGLGRLDEAEPELAALVEAKPEWRLPRRRLAELFVLRKRPDLALPIVRALLAEDPGDPDAARLLVRISLSPETYVEANLVMVDVMVAGGDAAGAVRLLEQTLEREPGDERVLRRLTELRGE